MIEKEIRAGVLTVSDKGSQGLRKDESGEIIFRMLKAQGFHIQQRKIIPDELQEAATMDGCSNIRFFVSIVLPLSGALISVMMLFYGVSHWNAFFDALIFLRRPNLYPLQLVLREILIQNQMTIDMLTEDMDTLAEQQMLGDLIKYGAIIVSSMPLLVLYPFLQRYFVKGVMIGAIKG